MIKVLSENSNHKCVGVTDRITVVYIGSPDYETVQIPLSPISEDLISRLQPENLGSRDITSALKKIDLELKSGESSRAANAKTLVILISDRLGAPCPGDVCQGSRSEPLLDSEVRDAVSRMIASEETTPVFHVIGLPPDNPDLNGYFSNTEALWDNILGTFGDFKRFDNKLVFLSEDLVSFVQENSQRQLINQGTTSFVVPPFTKEYDVFVFCDNASSDMAPIFENDTFNTVLQGSVSRAFLQNEISEDSNGVHYLLNDQRVGGRVKFQGTCERAIVFTQFSSLDAKQVVIENPIPKMYATGNPSDDKYKLIMTFDDPEVNWDAICSAYEFDFDVHIKNPDNLDIPWDSEFTCDPEKKWFISLTDLPNSEEGVFKIQATGTASSSSLEPMEVLKVDGQYTVKLKTRIGFSLLTPKAKDSKIPYPIHGGLFSKFWLKEQPLVFTVQLKNGETGVEINPLTLNNSQPLISLPATIIANDASLTSHEINLVQSPSEPSIYTGTFSDFDPEVSDYSLYVSLPQGTYDTLLYSQDSMGAEFERVDNLGTNPWTYYVIFFLIFTGLAVWAMLFLKSFSHPLKGFLVFFSPGNLSVPIAKIDLAPGHQQSKVLKEADLLKVSPFLSGIQQMDINAIYQDGSLDAVTLDIHYPEIEVPQKELLGLTKITQDPVTNQYELGAPVAESMKSSVKTQTGSMIVFTKE